MRSMIPALLALALTACDESLTGPEVPVDQEFVLAPGESSVVEDISVRFVSVPSDSRCPVDVTCVMAGDAHVQIVVTSAGSTRDYELHTRDMKPVVHDAYTIHLVKVAPDRISTDTIEPAEYRATLKVTK
jgi:hypothetical protein